MNGARRRYRTILPARLPACLVQKGGAYEGARDTTENGEANLTARCPISLATRQIVGCSARGERAGWRLSAFVGRTKAPKLKVISRTIIGSLSGHAKIADDFASVLCPRS